jgi:hypothetical protein
MSKCSESSSHASGPAPGVGVPWLFGPKRSGEAACHGAAAVLQTSRVLDKLGSGWR